MREDSWNAGMTGVSPLVLALQRTPWCSGYFLMFWEAFCYSQLSVCFVKLWEGLASKNKGLESGRPGRNPILLISIPVTLSINKCTAISDLHRFQFLMCTNNTLLNTFV